MNPKADGKLKKAREQNYAAHAKDLVDVQLQTNHEEEEDQAQVGNLSHRFVAVHQVEPQVGTHQNTTK